MSNDTLSISSRTSSRAFQCFENECKIMMYINIIIYTVYILFIIYIHLFQDSLNGFAFCLASRTACPKQRVDDRQWAHARGGFFCTEAWPGSDCAGEMGIPDDCIFKGDQGGDGKELFGNRHTAYLG